MLTFLEQQSQHIMHHFSVSSFPFNLKEHLLKMTTKHRAEMASKRGKTTVVEQGISPLYSPLRCPYYFRSTSHGLTIIIDI